MIDWQWLNSLEVFQGFLGQLLGVIGIGISILGTYYITNYNLNCNIKKEKKKEKRNIQKACKLIVEEIKLNNYLIITQQATGLQLSDEIYNKYYSVIINNVGNIDEIIAEYYLWIKLFMKFPNQKIVSNSSYSEGNKKIEDLKNLGNAIIEAYERDKDRI